MRPTTTLLTLALLVTLGLLFWRVWFQAAPPAPAVLGPTPPQLAFGDVYVGTTATATATWKSVTGGSATVTGLNIIGTNAAQFSGAPAAPLGNVSVSSSQPTPVITFTFAPAAEGAHQATASVLSAAPVFPLGLAGTGRFQIFTGDLAFLGGGNLNPGQALNFGRMQVGTAPKTKQFRVANVGQNPVQVTRFVLAAAGTEFAYTAPPLPFVIQPLMGTLVTVTFTTPAFTRPPNQMKFTSAITLQGQTVGNPAAAHSFGTALCGVGFYPAEEPELKC